MQEQSTPPLGEILHPDHGFVPPGHYYSPIPDWKQIRRDQARIFGPIPEQIAGISLDLEKQTGLLRDLARHYGTMPFKAERTEGLRYFFDNPSYSYCDAIFLHCMLRHLSPRRVVEIGSGYSSCVTLDTNEHFLGWQTDVTFVEPFPELLMSLLKSGDEDRVTIIPNRLQDVDIDVFRRLAAGDILFVDSTHVSRIDSDVNRIFFDILPALASGVYIHFHDVFYPFEYPAQWVANGQAWNEIYLMRAFLQYNHTFEPILMSTYLAQFNPAALARYMPLAVLNTGGNLWLRKR